jgi:hypothetical protein
VKALAAALCVMMTMTFMPWQASSVAERAGRYYGTKQVGRDPYHYEQFAIVIDKNGGVTGDGVTLADVKVTVDAISLRVVTGRPSSLPERVSGRFVRRAPPADAKGPVEEGILVDGTDWFLLLLKE